MLESYVSIFILHSVLLCKAENSVQSSAFLLGAIGALIKSVMFLDTSVGW